MVFRSWTLIVSFLAVLATVGDAHAQPPPSTIQSFVSGVRPSSALKRIDGGVFEVRQGESVDLTDRKILLTISRQQYDDPRGVRTVELYLAGLSGIKPRPGHTINFKEHFPKVFADKRYCALDVVDFVNPRGAPATATFRLTCP